MADDALTAEEFATWLTPRDALARVSEVLRNEDAAATGIVERLRGGALRAVAKTTAWEIQSGTRQGAALDAIPPGFWIELSPPVTRSLMWRTGDVRIFIARRMAGARTDVIAVRYFGVRFNPADIDAWLADLPPATPKHKYWRPKPQAEPPAPASVTEEPEAARGLPVSDSLLQAWHDLYQRAYADSPQDTEATAVKSALGMFPGKSVSRNRVRVLRGAQKRGRKPREQEG
jgi:hypothetical protein